MFWKKKWEQSFLSKYTLLSTPRLCMLSLRLVCLHYSKRRSSDKQIKSIEMSQAKRIQKFHGKESFSRMNFLYQASTLMAGKNNSLSAYYGELCKNIAKKSVIKMYVSGIFLTLTLKWLYDYTCALTISEFIIFKTFF